MLDHRIPLAAGTEVLLDTGSTYVISGEAIGMGGGSVLYPVVRLIEKDGIMQQDGLSYVLKECYPVSEGRVFLRDDCGEIVPQLLEQGNVDYLQKAQSMQLEEGVISRQIYQTASRVLPIREASETVRLTLPGMAPVRVSNTVTVMDSLSEKGRALSQWIKERGRFSPVETVRIIQQILFALREIHQAGFLHLDLQDGNIFLRGTLAPTDKSELVTLIDFGSARAVVDGKTAPIEDRVVFTTPGFSAPEILLHNDGTLQLGVEADLFSVGCLMLLLLTGQRPEVRRIMADTSGMLIKPNQLRRIKCPKHLVGKLQGILARALEKEPENRYHSADEMLVDVGDLAEALQPYRTDLSSVTYDAFVCYKHGPIDSQAALEVQRQLERFRAGKGVGQKRKPFSRVFVDEGELSSCADFGLQIREALKNSGWLIVICSPDTPTSPWVQSEIDTFLEYHDRSRILAVLTDGDENISFPERLRASKEGGEILAADARGKDLKSVMKKLRGDALLKIAAPMLGTTFDTLKQRQKVYALQRVAAATAAALLLTGAFAAYAVDRANVISEQAAQIEVARDEAVARAEQIAAQAEQIEEQAVQIEQEYENALINESLFLVQQAENRLAENDPLSAMELLLQALPSEEQQRPVVPGAEYLLGQALNIYTTPLEARNTVTVTGTIETDCREYFLNETGSNLYAWDSNKLQCWDTVSLTLLWEKEFPESIYSEPYLVADSCIIFETYDRMLSIDAKTGEELWSVRDINILDCFHLDGSDVVTVLSGKQETYWNTKTWNAETEIQFYIRMLNGITGELISEVPFKVAGDQYLTQVWSSLDLKWAAVCANQYGGEWLDDTPDALYVVDLETGQCRLVASPEKTICAVTFLADGSIVILKSAGTSAYYETTSRTPEIYLTPFSLVMEHYSAFGEELLWRQEVTCYMNGGLIREIRETDYDTGSETGKGILFAYNDRCFLFDQDTGQRIREYEFPDSMILFRCGGNHIVTVNADGTFTSINFATDTILNLPSFSQIISACCLSGNTLFVQHNQNLGEDFSIRRYEMDKADPSYQNCVEVESSEWSFEEVLQKSDGKGVFLRNGDRICVLDIKTGEQRVHHLSVKEDHFGPFIEGVSTKGTDVYWSESGYYRDSNRWIDGNAYYKTDVYSGETVEVPQPSKPAEHLTVYTPVFANDQIFFTADLIDSKELAVFSWDLRSGELVEWYRTKLEQGNGVLSMERLEHNSLTVLPDENQLFFATSKYEDDGERLWRLVLIDLVSGKISEICPKFLPSIGPEVDNPWLNDLWRWTNSGARAVFGYLDTLYVTDSSGDLISMIPLDPTAEAVRFSKDEANVLVLFSEAGLLREYRLEDGRLLNELNLTEYMETLLLLGSEDLVWENLDETAMILGDGLRHVIIGNAGDQRCIVATIGNYLDYDEQTGQFLIGGLEISDGGTFSVGTNNRYTLEDLMQMASELLGR